MQKRLLCLLSVLLVGGLLVGCVTPQKEAKGKTEEKEKIEYPVRDWEWYVNEDRGYKLKYPEGWDVYPLNQSGTLVGIYPPENKKIDRQIVISAIDKSLLSYQSLEEKFTKTFEHEKEVASEPGREFKLLEYKNTTLGGVHAIKAKWVRANNNSRYWFGEEWFTGISAIKGKLWYSLTFMLETEKGAPLDEEWEKIIDQVIASFRFI